MNAPAQGIGQGRALTPADLRAGPHHRNAVLAALSPPAFSVLESHLSHREFEEGSVLWDAGEHIERVYFPMSGIVSLVLPVKDGNGIEVASIGPEGAAGIDYRSGQSQSVTQGVTQIGGAFLYMSASQFARVARQNAEIDGIAAACRNWLLTQSQQMAACNAVHSADKRFCRWLLQCSERLNTDMVPATHESIARTLGIRRTTVTLIAQGLQMDGFISYRRGKIMIRDRERLRSGACDCCVVLGRHNWPSEQFVREEVE